MIRLLALLAAACGVAAAQAKEVHRTEPLAADGRVTIETHKGSIRVTAWDRDEVQIDVRIEEGSGLFTASVDLAAVRVHARAGAVEIESEYHRWGPFFGMGSQPFFHYTIQMPRTADLRIRDHKSDIEVSGLSADLDLNTHKGFVRVRDITGELAIETHKGVVEVSDLAGALILNTYKGEVRAGFASMDARSRVDTYKGTVDLELPRGSGFDLRTDLDRKVDFDSDFSVPRFGASRRDRLAASASVNGGGPDLRLKSHKGRIRLLER